MWPDPKQVQKKVDDFMAEFDKKKQEVCHNTRL